MRAPLAPISHSNRLEAPKPRKLVDPWNQLSCHLNCQVSWTVTVTLPRVDVLAAVAAAVEMMLTRCPSAKLYLENTLVCRQRNPQPKVHPTANQVSRSGKLKSCYKTRECCEFFN